MIEQDSAGTTLEGRTRWPTLTAFAPLRPVIFRFSPVARPRDGRDASRRMTGRAGSGAAASGARAAGSVRRRRPGLLLALLLGACAAPDIGPPGSISHGLRADPDDSVALATSPEMVRRSGGVLYFRMGLGWQRLADAGMCAGFGTCDRYRVRGVWLDRFLAVSHSTGEDTTVYFYDMHAGTRHVVGAVPVFGPDGRVFVAADHDERGEPDLLGTAIWDASEKGAPRQIRLFPVTDLAFPHIVGWRGRDCVELRGLAGYGTAAFDAAAPPITAFIVRTDGEWRMETAGRPAVCR